MSAALTPGIVIDAADWDAAAEPVDPSHVVAGAPTTRLSELDDAFGGGVGLWEMSPGAMSDVEADEVFVVTAGNATVDFIDPQLPSIELRPGSIVRLSEGMRTIWTVRETLTKVYLSA